MTTTPATTLYKIEFYVPETHLELVKTAMFAAGAGQVGAYDNCAWQTLGQGQYRPLAGSSPHLGETDKVETIAEYKVELVCERQYVRAVIDAMLAAHPYEAVAYSLLELTAIESI